ncbi:MAG TPA: hypothetical protein VLI54_04260 [Bacillota bacterium]|nr:hypothetical protein [Bacillota bacterium]
MTRTTEHQYSPGGVALAGCIFLGLGLGIWQGHGFAGLLGGLGVGLIAMAFFSQAK